MKLILSLIRKHLGMFMTAIFFLTLEAFSDLLQPTFMSHIVDDGIGKQDNQLILLYGAAMLLVAGSGAFCAIMRNLYASRTSQLIGKELRSLLYSKVQTLSFENIDKLKTASIITRITNDVTQIQNFINGSMRIMIKAPITCVGAIILIIIQTPKQLPMLLLILVVSAILIALNMVLGYPRFGRLQQRLDQLNSVSREFLSSIRVVKAFGREEFEENRFQHASNQLAESSISALHITAIFGPLINLTVNSGIVVLLWIGGTTNIQNIGKLMASVNYMTQVLFALGMVSTILNMAVRASASSHRVQEILDEVPTQHQSHSPVTTTIHGKITFNQVYFYYHASSVPALKDITLTIQAGETIGIIGSTGSGKTSLVNLIPRFYDVTTGTLSLDDIDVNSYDMTTLRNAISLVPQKPLLFSGTIRSNLLWGNPDATLAELQWATRIANADSFIVPLTNGYETQLGQGGVNLSGGQKQRLSIARALLRHPQILILDDCTSALDATTESSVLQGIQSSISDTTVLLISQRITTVMRAHRILCMENGEIAGFGTHEELLATCPNYKELYISQIGGLK